MLGGDEVWCQIKIAKNKQKKTVSEKFSRIYIFFKKNLKYTNITCWSPLTVFYDRI